MKNRVILLFSALLMSLSCHSVAISAPQLPVMANGWYPWEPYQFLENNTQLTGMDIELVQTITKKTGRSVSYTPVSWQMHQDDLRSGKRDFAAGATKTKAREAFVNFSEPYRYEENSLFTKRDFAETFTFKNMTEFINEIQSKKIKLAVINGFIYADAGLNAFIDDPKNASLIIKTHSDQESLLLLDQGKVQGFLADTVVGAAVIRNDKLGKVMQEIPLHIRTPIHFMFSKKSVPLSVVEEFNTAIVAYRETSAYKHTVTEYLAPILLLKTIDSRWFHVLEIIGTIAFAISGVLIAFEQRSTLLAAFLFAFLPSFGGGVIRDTLFGISPVRILQSPTYFLIVVGVVLLAYFLSLWARAPLETFFNRFLPNRIRHKTENFYLSLFDGIGLATFTISGIFVTLLAKVEPLWLWGPFFALLTSISGGILRDIIAQRKQMIALSGVLYGEWVLLWGFFFSYYLHANAMTISEEVITTGIFVTVGGVFLSRLLGYYFDAKNLFFR